MAARRGEDVDRRADQISGLRDHEAVINNDIDHWTTPTVRAMQAHLSGQDPSTLKRQSLPEIMDTCRDIARDTQMSDLERRSFGRRMNAFIAGQDDPDKTDFPRAAEAVETATTGYARHRVAGAVGEGERLGRGSLAKRAAAEKSDPRSAGLAELGQKMAVINQRLDQTYESASIAADAPAHNAKLASDVQGLLKASQNFLFADTKPSAKIDGPEAKRNPVSEIKRLNAMQKNAAMIAKAPNSEQALGAAADLMKGASQIVGGATPYAKAASSEFADLGKTLRAHASAATNDRTTARTDQKRAGVELDA